MSTSGLMGITGDYSEDPSFYTVVTSDGGDPPVLTTTITREYGERDGFDLIWRQAELQNQMAEIEEDIRAIEANANLSDTEKMFALQMAANTWNAIATARTNILKCVSDVLKAIVRNIA